MENKEYSKFIFLSKEAQNNFDKSTDLEKKQLADFLAKCCWETQLKIEEELTSVEIKNKENN